MVRRQRKLGLINVPTNLLPYHIFHAFLCLLIVDAVLCCRVSPESNSSSDKCTEGPVAKKHAGDKKVVDKMKKDKKKTLKRL